MRLAPLGPTSVLEFETRENTSLDVAPNGADSVFVLVSIKMWLLRSQAHKAGREKTSVLATDITEY